MTELIDMAVTKLLDDIEARYPDFCVERRRPLGPTQAVD